MTQPASAYFMEERHDPTEAHTLSVLVQNEPGVLARVIGLFSGRGYNIESLTVAEVAHESHLSRITIVTTGTPETIEQISHQLERIVPIHKVTDLSLHGNIDFDLFRRWVVGEAVSSGRVLVLAVEAVMAGIVPAIHVLLRKQGRRGCPARGRALRMRDDRDEEHDSAGIRLLHGRAP